MKNFLLVLFFLIAGAGVAASIYFYTQYNSITAERDQLVQQNGELQIAIDAIGPITEVYTVTTDVIAGAEVQEEQLTLQTIPVSSVTDAYCKSKTEILGKYWKINMSPGVSVTKDCLMEDAMENILYERDLSFTYLPLGIKVGDYVDIRVVLPYGEEFVVLSHQRVRQLVEQTNTIKLVLTEAENTLWNSALKDVALFGTKGLSVYVTKYIEPGITDHAITYYPVRAEMEVTVKLNPNIIDKNRCVNSKLRQEIDYLLTQVDEIDASNLVSGVAAEASSINNSKSNYYEESSTYTGGETSFEQQVNEAYETLIDLDITDSNGNASSITGSQVENAGGENPYVGEPPIE